MEHCWYFQNWCYKRLLKIEFVLPIIVIYGSRWLTNNFLLDITQPITYIIHVTCFKHELYKELTGIQVNLHTHRDKLSYVKLFRIRKSILKFTIQMKFQFRKINSDIYRNNAPIQLLMFLNESWSNPWL